MLPAFVGRRPQVDFMGSLSQPVSLSEKKVEDSKNKEVEEGR